MNSWALMVAHTSPAVRRARQDRFYSGPKPRGRFKHERAARWERQKVRREGKAPPPEAYQGQRTAYLVGAWRPMTDDDIAAHNEAARGEQA